jgi:heat shock protein HtpX
MITTVGSPCGTCGFSLVSERGAAPWCARCGWNLDLFEPDRRAPEIGWNWVDRLTFRTAYRLNAVEFADLSGRGAEPVGFSPLKALIAAISVGLLLVVVGIAALGVWCIVDLHSFLGWLFGLILIMIAVVLRPRFGRLSKYATPISESTAPALFALIAQVAAAVGTRTPHTVLVTSSFNASSGQYGLRRRRVLTIGLPLWLSLAPQHRVALLGHELGHFVNGDVRRGPLTGLAFSFFDTLSGLTRPSHRSFAPRTASGGLAVIAEWITGLILAVLHGVFTVLQVGLVWLAMRATHTAEYAADRVASEAAGSPATASMLDRLLLRDGCMTVLGRAARNDPDPAHWRAEVATSMAGAQDRIPRLRQLSSRDDASLFRSHPPTGLRAQMAVARPQITAKVVLSEAEAARIDGELAPMFRSLRTDLVHGQ